MAAPPTTPEPGKGPGYYEDLINRVDTRIEEGGAAAEAPHPTTPVGPLPFVCHNHSLLALFFAADGEVPPVMASCACCIDVGPLRRRQRFYVFFFVMALTFFTYGEVLACPAPFPAHPWTGQTDSLHLRAHKGRSRLSLAVMASSLARSSFIHLAPPPATLSNTALSLILSITYPCTPYAHPHPHPHPRNYRTSFRTVQLVAGLPGATGRRLGLLRLLPRRSPTVVLPEECAPSHLTHHERTVPDPQGEEERTERAAARGAYGEEGGGGVQDSGGRSVFYIGR
jgi:hypothetical protein